MARKKKEQPIIEGLEITGVAAEGNALARLDNMVVFIPYGAPGDIADVKIVRKKHSYAEGRIERLQQPAAIRVEPRCSHFGLCGGCRWQHLPYDFQLQCKRQQVVDCLDRIAKIPHPEVAHALGSEEIWDYRNKMEYTFCSKLWLTPEQMASDEEFADRRAAGFHIPGAFDKVLDIDFCHLQDAGIGNELRNFVKQFGKDHGLSFYDLRENHGLLRTMMIRTASTGEVMVLMSFGEDDPQAINAVMTAINEKFGNRITALLYVVNLKCNDTFADLEVHTFAGRDYIEEEMEGLRFRVGPKSFYQTNSRQAYRLYSVARELADLKGDELVYDLYTGTGTIAQFIARRARRVIGIEYVPEAIADAKINAANNGLGNTEFYAGDMKDILTDEFIAAHGRPDVMIVDPPRAGMHEDVVRVILNAAPRRIVYVSCNPATQARDLALLNEKYDVDAVQPVDMFPHTAHIENVCRLTLRV
ncbi:MAG: 23S rRNA (uracil(1939)-C(5))-methyltransferase RlmD [Bacteroides sp.]|nr:23S rRNA (uracil(1939)-C(5))-methyltransferase RlmD [Bacteroides sp.]MCM1378964.1 23S rRNA (uracil(1939)-C(5))-methyltransferase RlmD [Bacteroides sp.]MCM1445580.1 23S rRNA (uracil(1939)-C(5))-methyltransferase RlmD [Prevotella sp.]